MGSKDIEIRKVELVTKTQKSLWSSQKKRGGHTTGHKKEKEMAKLA